MKKIAGDIIILHMCTKNHNHMMYGSWDMEWDRQIFLSFWAIFCAFTPAFLMILKIKIFRKNENSAWRFIILHRCNINYNHMIYGSWDTKWDRKNFLSFWVIFCTFTPALLMIPKIKIFRINENNAWRFIIVQRCTINYNHMIYGSWDTEWDRKNFLSFWAIFCLFSPLTTQKMII